MNNKIRNIKTGEEYEVSTNDVYRILEFQKPVKNWRKLDKLLMTGGKNGHCLISNKSFYFDWELFVKEHPEFKEDIERMFVMNRLNTVMEITMLNAEKELVSKSILFNIEEYKIA